MHEVKTNRLGKCARSGLVCVYVYKYIYVSYAYVHTYILVYTYAWVHACRHTHLKQNSVGHEVKREYEQLRHSFLSV